MSHSTVKIICIVAVVIVVILILNSNSCNVKENAELKAYHFGFPTSGSYDYGGGPLTGEWPNPWWPTYTPYTGGGIPYYGDWGGYAPLPTGPMAIGRPRYGPPYGWYYSNLI